MTNLTSHGTTARNRGSEILFISFNNLSTINHQYLANSPYSGESVNNQYEVDKSDEMSTSQLSTLLGFYSVDIIVTEIPDYSSLLP